MAVPALHGAIQPLESTIGAGAGGVFFLGGSPPSNLADQIAGADRSLPVPLLVMADEEGGGVQQLRGLVADIPWARQMAATMTPGQVTALAARTARAMRALGVGVDLAPVLDLDAGQGPNAADADGMRSFSDDPVKASRYGLAFVAGLRQGGVIPVAKHFPGLGGAGANTDYGPASTQPLSSLTDNGLQPFRAAIAAGVPAIMVANAAVPGLTSGPASLSSAAIDGLLRQTLGFRGLVVTDSLSAGAITATGRSVESAAVEAVRVGADVVLFGSTLTAAETARLSPAGVHTTFLAIVDEMAKAVSTGALPEGRLDAAILAVLAAKGVDLCKA